MNDQTTQLSQLSGNNSENKSAAAVREEYEMDHSESGPNSTLNLLETACLTEGQGVNNYLASLACLRPPRRYGSLGYVSLFCGGGGLDLGFASAGIRPLYSSDVVPVFCETVRNNLPKHLVEALDITKLNGLSLKRKLGESVDVIVGGPPCQSFSILGDRKSTSDPRGKLVFEYARIIRQIRPRSFLFENVPGILTVNGGRDWRELLNYFESETGYHIAWTKLNSAHFGVPQIRNRVVAVGFRNVRDFQKFSWPDPTHAEDGRDRRATPTAAEALAQVAGLPNHILRAHGERVMQRYSTIAPGGRDRKDHTDRIHPNRPSGTVLVGSGAGGGRPFIHHKEHRHITVREAARLQSFPDWWIFAGGPTAAYRQVGNAVPPMMARAIAQQIKKSLT